LKSRGAPLRHFRKPLSGGDVQLKRIVLVGLGPKANSIRQQITLRPANQLLVHVPRNRRQAKEKADQTSVQKRGTRFELPSSERCILPFHERRNEPEQLAVGPWMIGVVRPGFGGNLGKALAKI